MELRVKKEPMTFVCFSESSEHTNLARGFCDCSLLGQYLILLGFWPHMCIWEAGKGEKPELAVRIMKQDFVKIDRSVQ